VSPPHTRKRGLMHFAATLRRELAARARCYAEDHNLPHCLSYCEAPVVCFEPGDGVAMHGNFMTASYTRILADPALKRRLEKVHTLGHRSFPRVDRGRWMELDTCTSSDALLMNIFCHPGVLREGKVATLLGIASASSTCFGYRARVPLANGKADRTEVDLRWGDELIEAKLTESDFQFAEKRKMAVYRDFMEIFDSERLPQTGDHYVSYQLLRNVLAAYALGCSFRVLVDARRPDLIDAWYHVMSCVKPVQLRTELRISTWQEVAKVVPPKLQAFLSQKYGIGIRSEAMAGRNDDPGFDREISSYCG
jgi:hypothetical protein